MTAYEWDSTIEKDGGDFKLLPEGVYPFTIKKVEKGFYNGGKSIPPCPKASLTLRVGSGSESSDVTDSMLLDDSLEWKLCQFFLGIGARKHGEPLKMNWDESFLVGKGGYVDIEHREYEKDGETKYANQVSRYLEPADFPKASAAADGGSAESDAW